MAKFHLSQDGNPRVCTAAEGNCPLGSDEPHFSTKIQARSAYEASLDAELIAPSITKKLPNTLLPVAEKESIETVTPEREYDYVYKPTTAGKLRKDDVYRFDNGDHGVIQEVKLGTKNATIRILDDSGKSRVLVHKLDLSVSVNAKVETDASKERSRVAAFEGNLESSLKGYEPRQAKAMAEMILKTQKGHSFSSWDYKALIAASASDQVMSIYESAVSSTKAAITEGREGYSNETNPYTRAYENVKDSFTREIMQNAGRGESNSTSAISNETERELIRAKADFLDKIRWGW